MCVVGVLLSVLFSVGVTGCQLLSVCVVGVLLSVLFSVGVSCCQCLVSVSVGDGEGDSVEHVNIDFLK